MRRAVDEELVSISPPPQFRDIHTLALSPSNENASLLVVPLPPPPQDFRDLTPSPGDPLLTFGLTPHTLPPFQSFHHGKTFIRKSVSDFADRVSFGIVNEAVVIATVLPEAGSRRVFDFRKDGNLNSGSFDEEAEGVLSASSSWEYLPPPSSSSSGNGKVKAGGDKSLENGRRRRSFVSEDENLHFVVVRDEVPCGWRDTDVRVDPQVPFHCDIYSLPIDSVKTSNPTHHHQPPPLRPRSTHHQRFKEFKRHSLQILDIDHGDRFHGPSSSASAERINKSPLGLGTVSSILFDHGGGGDKDRKRNGGSNRRRERNNNNENLSNVIPVPTEVVSISVGQSQEEPQDRIRNSSSQNLGDLREKKKGKGLAFLNLFRRIRHKEQKVLISSNSNSITQNEDDPPPRSNLSECRLSRALPPPPPRIPETGDPGMGFRCVEVRVSPGDVPASLQEVKDCGWYWGPLASEGAEDLLRGEPDGSFIVRDSSDPRYIFSLTFKLNGLIRHVRIEHDHGNFSFGPLTRFKASTIVDFVEKAVAHSRSGRYLFFLHRRPVLGPMRVQLLHPYSRFRHPRSLQHMCRFVILKCVRRDFVETLGLPKLLLDYLNAPQYYFEPHQPAS